ncbi:hypothetical protein [Enhygromyxa salina]|uniref:hypothetical protein n=1 Tax=Enhygromyxa salina TaxID=215803 RepID=UPI0004E6155D|nr:hypothetical protein [Enhygromyxa salina]
MSEGAGAGADEDRLGPAVRASYLRALLFACDEFGPPAMEIREQLGDTHQTSIECAGPLVWLPIEADIALQRALARVLGAERTRAFVLANLREFMAASILQNIVQTAVGLFGLDPGSFARLLPRAWGMLYRDCGRWSVSRSLDPDRARAREWREVQMCLSRLPQACASEDAWLAAVATVQHALLILCGRAHDEGEGEVELLERVLDEPSQVVFRLAWKNR